MQGRGFGDKLQKVVTTSFHIEINYPLHLVIDRKYGLTMALKLMWISVQKDFT